MAFSIDHASQPRRRFVFQVRRQSDGYYWTAGGWAINPAYLVLPEQTLGYYSFLLLSTRKEESYEVSIRSLPGYGLVKTYVCDSTGKPQDPARESPVNITFQQGILHIDHRPETAAVLYESLSSNGVTKYTAIKWHPSGITTCNCPGWSSAAKHRGKSLASRSCKHTQVVATLAQSVVLPGSIHPSAESSGSHSVRTGRGIELD